MMIFNVAGLLKENSGSVRKYQIDDESLSLEGLGSFHNISGPVTMMRTDRTVLVTADLDAVTEVMCSRCLEKASLKLHARIEEEFYPVNSDLGGPQRASSLVSDPFDPVLWIDDRNELDLSEVVLQSLSGVAPIAPLCSERCKGICPVCRRNRNRTPCDCEQEVTDPRWAALAALRNKQESARD